MVLRLAHESLRNEAAGPSSTKHPVSPDTLLDLIGGALLFRADRRGGHVDDVFLRQLLDLVVAGLSSGAPPA